MPARIAEAAALSPSSFRKSYRSSYETPSPSSSLTLLVRKRYRGTSELIEDTEDSDGQGLDDEGQGLEDEGPSMEEEEEATPEGQQQVVLVVNTATSEPLGLGYGAARRRALESTEEIEPSTYEVGQSSRVYTDIPTYAPPAAPVQTLPSPEWSSGSLLVSPSSPVVPSLIASPVTTPAATISDLRELYTRSGVVRDEIFLQRYRFRSLEREQERATMTFSAIWRPILALEAWAGQTDA
ncbi:hypothetical protein Tco_1465019 [Tanacetum coccineum]